MSVVVQLSGVSKSFGAMPVITGLSLEVGEGELLALLGPSGCGKTTVLRLIAGFERPDEGEIVLSSRLVAGGRVWVPPEERGVGMVFQDYALFPHLTVAQNIAFGLHRLSADDRQRRIAEVMALAGLAELGDRYPYQLSGGQQQRVALARALAPSPRLVLLDEPFSNLDTDLRAQIRPEVERILRGANTTALLVTHDQEEAMDMGDRMGILNNGRLEQLDRPETVYHWPATRFVADFVGQADFLAGRVADKTILTEIGAFPCKLGLADGARVEMMLRPDDVQLFPDEAGGAEIIARRFRGPQNLYTIRLPSGKHVHSSQPSTVLFDPGMRVNLKVELSHVVAFPIVD
ncbi:MAG: ABC transporter ATP-binding protein [Chloroflexi bacterium]|nr:ABC transporter ATP-binding protein [Chloroflexota bacterium]